MVKSALTVLHQLVEKAIAAISSKSLSYCFGGNPRTGGLRDDGIFAGHSATPKSRRVQLPARRRYLCSWQADQSDPPDVGALRNAACHSPTELHVQIYAGAGNHSHARQGSRRSSDRWSLVLHGFHVCRYLLDVAGVVADPLGFARRHLCSDSSEHWRWQLLGAKLLGWRAACRRRCVAPGRRAPSHGHSRARVTR